MIRRHDGTHGESCFGCKIRFIQFNERTTHPSRTPSQVAPDRPHNNWEKGILTDDRGLPVKRSGQVIGLKEYAQDKRRIDEQLRAVKQGTL